MKNAGNHIKLIKESLDWWQEESLKTSFECERIEKLYEAGEITEEDIFDELQDLCNKINYLSQKGVFEHRQLLESAKNRHE